jgi:hypothetical protein
MATPGILGRDSLQSFAPPAFAGFAIIVAPRDPGAADELSRHHKQEYRQPRQCRDILAISATTTLPWTIGCDTKSGKRQPVRSCGAAGLAAALVARRCARSFFSGDARRTLRYAHPIGDVARGFGSGARSHAECDSRLGSRSHHPLPPRGTMAHLARSDVGPRRGAGSQRPRRVCRAARYREQSDSRRWRPPE